MKKLYVKPTLYMERFALTQSLTSCGIHIGHADQQCVLTDDDAPFEMKDYALEGWFLGGCSEYWVGTDGTDGFCYHTLANIVFSS